MIHSSDTMGTDTKGNYYRMHRSLDVYTEGFHLGALLGLVIIILHIVGSILALQYHQSEHDALIQFMNELED